MEGSLQGAAATMTRLGVPHEQLDAEELAERFPGLVPRGRGRGSRDGGSSSTTSSTADMSPASSVRSSMETSDGESSDGEAKAEVEAEAADMGLFEPGGGSINASAAVRTGRPLPHPCADFFSEKDACFAG